LPSAKVQELQENAWLQLQQDVLMMQQANKYNLSSTDDELYMFLRSSPPVELRQATFFQTNGQFDAQKYMSALADPNYASLWNQFEPLIREQIKKQKLYSLIVQTAHITENEVRNSFIDANEKLKVGMINVPKTKFSTPKPEFTDEEVIEYFQNNRDNYKLNERANGKYVFFDKVVTERDLEISQQKINEIYDSLIAGSDFEEFARIYSQDGSASKGGDLGWFEQGQMVKEFDSAVFSMNKGDLSSPIKTQFGYHIIKLHDTKKEDNINKALASHILIKSEVTSESLDTYYNTLEDFRITAFDIGFEQAAAQYELTIKDIKPVEKNKNNTVIGNDRASKDFLFNSKEDEISPIFESSRQMYVLQAKGILEPGLAAFEDVKITVRRDLTNEIIQNICKDTATIIFADIEQGVEISKAAKNHAMTYEILAEINRNSTVKGLGRNPIALANAFSLKEINDVSEPYTYANGSVMFKLLEKFSPDLTEFTEKRDSIKTSILNTRQQQLFNDWYTKLVEESDIISNIGNRFSESGI
jgi:parvulin-like peptidyl-prolyl isomerase